MIEFPVPMELMREKKKLLKLSSLLPLWAGDDTWVTQ
jgi:hypothetical protein